MIKLTFVFQMETNQPFAFSLKFSSCSLKKMSKNGWTSSQKWRNLHKSFNSGFSLTLAAKGFMWKPQTAEFLTYRNVCLYLHTFTESSSCLLGSSTERSPFEPGFLWNYLQISLAKKTFPGCFSATSNCCWCPVVDGLCSACVVLHEILNRALACFGQLNYLFHYCAAPSAASCAPHGGLFKI